MPFSNQYKAAPTWSRRDEEALKALLERKAAFEAQNREPLKAAITALSQTLGITVKRMDNFADAMIKHAGQIRDALAPYDSGVRPADDTP